MLSEEQVTDLDSIDAFCLLCLMLAFFPLVRGSRKEKDSATNKDWR